MITTNVLTISSPSVTIPILSKRWIENGRMRDKNGYLHWNGISDFYLPKYFGGRESEIQSRLDWYRSVNRNGVRVFCSVNNNDGNYLFEEDRMDWVYGELTKRGLYPEFCLFADTQRNYPSQEARRNVIRRFAAFCRARLVLPQIVNEAQFNGFTSAIDPELIELAEIFADEYGSRDFSITDSLDGDDESASKEQQLIYNELAKYSNVLVLHPSRMTTSDPWRWTNHLKGFRDIVDTASHVSGNNNVYGIHDEPKKAASNDSGNRESNPYHHIASNFVANCCALGYTGHYIPEQDNAFPGLDIMGISNSIKAGPTFIFRNAGTQGSAVKSFTGYTKVRPCDNSNEAYAVGYGGNGDVIWDGYNNVEILYSSEEVKLYHATR